jgi:multidrug resistance efflux pump
MVFGYMNLRSLVAIVSLVLLGVLAAVFFLLRSRQPEPEPEPVAAVVETELSLPATLQAAITVPVPVPVEGKVELFQVEVGDEVYEGQMLAQIRSEALETDRLAAETDLERAAERVRNLEATLSAVRLEASRASADASRVRNEYEKASRNYERQKMLYAEGATPRLTYEKAQQDHATKEVESRNLDAVASSAEERISLTQRELDGARKLLEGKAADLEQSNARIGSGYVVSPVSGIVVSRRGQEGDQVHPSVPDLFRIASDLSTMQAVANAPLSQIDRIKEGQPVAVTLAEMGGEVLEGVITRIDDGRVIVEFANPNPAVRPGLTAHIRIKLT